LYRNTAADYEDIPFPGTGQPVNVWGHVVRVSYNSDREAMYLLGPAHTRKRGEGDPVEYLARYVNWSNTDSSK